MNARTEYLDAVEALAKPYSWGDLATAADYCRPLPLLIGYASVFGVLSQGARGRMVIRKGAFRRATESLRGVPVLDGHDPRIRLGRTRLLDEDAIGLWVVAAADNHGCSRSVVRRVSGGHVWGWSAAFTHTSRRLLTGVVEVRSAELVEVSTADRPACPTTCIRLAPYQDTNHLAALLRTANQEARDAGEDRVFDHDKAEQRERLIDLMHPMSDLEPVGAA